MERTIMSDELRPIDADNHYYEALDAFTRHLDPAFKNRGVRVMKEGTQVGQHVSVTPYYEEDIRKLADTIAGAHPRAVGLGGDFHRGVSRA